MTIADLRRISRQALVFLHRGEIVPAKRVERVSVREYLPERLMHLIRRHRLHEMLVEHVAQRLGKQPSVDDRHLEIPAVVRISREKADTTCAMKRSISAYSHPTGCEHSCAGAPLG